MFRKAVNVTANQARPEAIQKQHILAMRAFFSPPGNYFSAGTTILNQAGAPAH
jgi:hypothetical protein